MKSKKILFSSFVVIVFVAYAVSLRLKGNLFRVFEDDDRARVIPPITTQTQTQSQNTSPMMTSPSTSMMGSGARSPMMGAYRDGQYLGTIADAYYGNVQVSVAIQNGKITDVKFLDYPQDRSTSREINGQAMPFLITEAIQAQSANVNVISGATETSRAFKESLASALNKAKY